MTTFAAAYDKDPRGWYVTDANRTNELVCDSYDYEALIADFNSHDGPIVVDWPHLMPTKVVHGVRTNKAQAFTSQELNIIAERTQNDIYLFVSAHGQMKKAADRFGIWETKPNGGVVRDEFGRPSADKSRDTEAILKALNSGYFQTPTKLFNGSEPPAERSVEDARLWSQAIFNAFRNEHEQSHELYVLMQEIVNENIEEEILQPFIQRTPKGAVRRYKESGMPKFDDADMLRIGFIVAQTSIQYDMGIKKILERVVGMHNYGRGLLRAGVMQAWQRREKRFFYEKHNLPKKNSWKYRYQTPDEDETIAAEAVDRKMLHRKWQKELRHLCRFFHNKLIERGYNA